MQLCSEYQYLFRTFTEATERWRMFIAERARLESTTGLTPEQTDEFATRVAASKDKAFSALVEHSTKHGCGGL
jgi:hypothetical protein